MRLIMALYPSFFSINCALRANNCPIILCQRNFSVTILIHSLKLPVFPGGHVYHSAVFPFDQLCTSVSTVALIIRSPVHLINKEIQFLKFVATLSWLSCFYRDSTQTGFSCIFVHYLYLVKEKLLIGNVRIVALLCPFEGTPSLIIFTVSPTDSINNRILPLRCNKCQYTVEIFTRLAFLSIGYK